MTRNGLSDSIRKRGIKLWGVKYWGVNAPPSGAWRLMVCIGRLPDNVFRFKDVLNGNEHDFDLLCLIGRSPIIEPFVLTDAARAFLEMRESLCLYLNTNATPVTNSLKPS